MNRRTTMWGLALLVISSLVLSACGGGGTAPAAPSGQPSQTGASQPAREKVLRVGLDSDPPKMDPHQSSAAVDRQVFQSLYDKLVDLDKDLKIVPMLAEKWEVSADGKTYTFTLRKGVVFHDGEPFNAAAVKANFDRILDPNTPDKEVYAPRRSEINLVDKVEARDEYTVVVTLKKPFSPFLSILSDRAGMMVSPNAIKQYGKDVLNHPVGTGPYKFVEKVKGDRIVLARNEKYWNPSAVTFDKVIFRPFTDGNARLLNLRSGELDIINLVPPREVPTLKNDPKVTLSQAPDLGYQGIWLNVTKPPFNNKALRQALAAAIDRDALVKVVFQETAVPSTSPFAPGTPFHAAAPPLPKRDVALAKQKLAEAGVPNGFEFTLTIEGGKQEERQIAETVQNMAREAGINVKIEEVEFGVLLEKGSKHDFQAMRLGWSGRPDPDQNIYAFRYTGQSNNYSGYSNKQVDKLLDDARTAGGEAERIALYKQIMTILTDEMPYIHLFHRLEYKAFAKGLKGFQHVPDGMIRLHGVTLQ